LEEQGIEWREITQPDNEIEKFLEVLAIGIEFGVLKQFVQQSSLLNISE